MLAVVTVTTLADTIDFNDGVTSLREAIFATNTVPGADTIEFAPNLFEAGGPKTILLTQGELAITDSLTINGPGASLLTIDAQQQSRIFNISDGDSSRDANVSLSSMTLERGRANLQNGGAILNSENLGIVNGTFQRNYANGHGGGIFSTAGKLTISGSIFSGNTSLDRGGGLAVFDGALEISDCLIENNSAPNDGGGGIATINAPTSIARCTVKNNSAYRGGGIRSQGETLILADSVISGNTTHAGGGIDAHQNAVQISRCTINDNRAIHGNGAGILSTDAELTIMDSVLNGNSATYGSGGGGGIYSLRGNLSISNAVIAGNSSKGYGGGICKRYGWLNVVDSTVDGNTTVSYGGGIFVDGTTATSIVGNSIRDNSAAGGGGVFSVGDIALIDCSVSQNVSTLPRVAFGGGGGVWNFGGSVTIDRCTVSDNATAFSGGGIYQYDGQLSITQSTIGGNTAAYDGGGIYNRFSHLALTNSTVSGNAAGKNGGGLYTSAGGLHSSLVRTTLAFNTAGGSAGGIYVYDGILSLDHVIVAANSAPEAPDLDVLTVYTASVSSRYSLIGDIGVVSLTEAPVGSPDANGNLIGGPVNGVIDPKLGPLADNGGFDLPDGSHILTHALLPGSPAINAGDLNAVAGQGDVPEFDQRGEPFGRVVGGRIDIGAFEYQTPTDLNLLVDTLEDESDGNYSRGDLSLREAIELANAANYAGVVDTIRFDPALTAGGPATIRLTLGELAITDSLTITGPGASLLTIDASGNDLTPDSTLTDGDSTNDGDGSRVFNIDDGNSSSFIDISIGGIKLTGGDASGDIFAARGGAILSSENIFIVNSIISGNSVGGVRFPGATFGNGGGIYCGGDATIENTILSNNSAGGSGGAIFVRGNLTVDRSTISENTAMDRATRGGGGIYSYAGSSAPPNSLTVRDSFISNNSAVNGEGGGIRKPGGGSLLIERTVVSDNTAFHAGGGVSAADFGIYARIHQCTINGNAATSASSGWGGGILIWYGTLVVSESSVSGNIANFGGGIYMHSSDVTVTGSTISDNRANGGGGILLDGYSLSVTDSTISGNSASGSGGGIFADLAAVRISDSTISGNSAMGDGGGIWSHTSLSSRSRVFELP